MKQVRTVFVLGAGASAPFNYPLGRTLVSDILRYNPAGMPARPLSGEKGRYAAFAAALRDSGAYSVDLFLERNERFMDVGKRAIARALILHECNDDLWCDEYPSDSYPTRTGNIDNWYKYLFNKLVVGVPFEDVNRWSLGFVTFNYDRSLEHFLFTTAKNFYGKSDDETANALKDLPFIHVHGHLGLLPWQQGSTGRRPYEYRMDDAVISEAAAQIKILHEAQESSPEFDAARGLIRNAERVYVLGFGYHPTNVKRLQLGMGELKVPPVGTCVGLTDEERNSINRLGCNVHFSPTDGIVYFLRRSQSFVDMKWTD
jgi:hypothetical protein